VLSISKPLANIVEATITPQGRLILSNVFVLDTNKQPLNPVNPGRARILLSSGKAAVFKRYPFTIILKVAVEHPRLEPLHLKLDPGSHTTGIAVVNDTTAEVIFAAELTHRGQTIKERLDTRRAIRRSRRQRHTRYRKPRFDNRRRPQGWLPPSLESRLANTLTWARRLIRLSPITSISQELVKFDLLQMDKPEISGVEYQQGTRAGYELREYLLEKWQRRCAYCGKGNVPLQIEHIHPRSKGGTDRVGNLTLACEPCNIAKGANDIREFLKDKPEVLKRILAQAKGTLKDATAVNAVRWELFHRLQDLGLSLECGSGGRTKFNRLSQGLAKAHWIDAACVGKSTPPCLFVQRVVPLLITANGSGSRQMCRMDKYGFVRTEPKQAKRVKGFQSGDIVRAEVRTGKKVGTYVGRVAVRTTGSFNLTTKNGTVQGISHRFCTPLHRCDGYSYQAGAPDPCPKKGTPLSSPASMTGVSRGGIL
jgi:5-methylcytosine-specific restriction endonuclease McrA